MITVGILASQNAGATYATLQSITSNVPISGGGLTFNGKAIASVATAGTTIATIGKSSGKWYWEVRINAANPSPGGAQFVMVGAVNYIPTSDNNTSMFSTTQGVAWRANSLSYCIAKNITGVTPQGTGCTSFQLAAGTVVSFALDMDTGILKIFINGTQRGGDVTGLTGTWYPAVGSQGFDASQGTCNFGQNAWSTNATVQATRLTLAGLGYNMGVYNL